MKKYLLFTGALAAFGLMAFFGPTKADQLKDVEVKVKAGLEEFRAGEKAKCDARVEEAVATKVAEMATAPVVPTPAPALAAPTKGTKKGTVKGGPKAPTVPTPAPPPTKPTDAKTRGGAAPEGTNEAKSRGGAAPEGVNKPKTRGGAVKVEGGGGK